VEEELSEEVLIEAHKLVDSGAKVGGSLLQVGHDSLLQLHEPVLVRGLGPATHTHTHTIDGRKKEMRAQDNGGMKKRSGAGVPRGLRGWDPERFRPLPC
jgi:hypothetical protein